MPLYLPILFFGKRKKEFYLSDYYFVFEKKGKRNQAFYLLFWKKGEKEKGTMRFKHLDLVFLKKKKGILPGEFDFLFPPRAKDS